MAMEVILSTVYLDVYDHDTTPSTIKTIALDSQTRYVEAYLKKNDENYSPDLSSVVTLTAIRPDKVGAESIGRVKLLVPGTEDREETTYDEDGNPVTVIIPGEPAVYGLEAEITQAMIAVPGIVLFQFKMEVDNKVLRTEIFRSNNGRALDGEASSWADEYQGYNLDELVRKVEAIGLGGVQIDGDTLKITTIDEAASEYHAYVDTQLAAIRAELANRVLTTDNRIEIRPLGGGS